MEVRGKAGEVGGEGERKRERKNGEGEKVGRL